ncbi:MAG: hypothetical protein ABFR36_06315 [Acidobacteriota bacterium]
MKKIYLLFLIIFTCAGLVGGAITVKKPYPGQPFEQGKPLVIQWNKGTCNAPSVKINIFRNSISQPNFVLQLTGPNTGAKQWYIPGNFTPGNYILRIKTDQKGCIGDSGVFNIVNKKDPDFAIVQVEALKPPPSTDPDRHRAPAIGQPSNATFNIKSIHCGVDKNGQLNAVWVVVGYTSKTPFAFNKYKGHPSDGPAYMNCKIMIPYWPDDPAYKGPFKTKVIFNHRLSVKYSGQNNMKCEPELLNAGTGEFEIIFAPAHSGKVEGLYTKQKLPKTNFFQGHDNYCKKTYWPKMALRLFVHTREGVKQSYKEFYLNRGAKVKSATIPGNIKICIEGFQRW